MSIAHFELTLSKSIAQGTAVNLMALFNSDQRFRYFALQESLLENTPVQVLIDGIEPLTLAVGNDMQAGQKKTLMTLFWYPERLQNALAQRDLQAGQTLSVQITQASSAAALQLRSA